MRTLLTTLHSKYIHASLALPYLAAYCREGCGEILIEEYTLNEPKESLLGRIFAQGADVICFSVYLWNRTLTLELVESLKRIDPELKIILGGPETSFEPDDFFLRYPVDAVVCGEGEIPLRHLLQAWRSGREPDPIPGLKTPVCPTDRGWSLLEDLDDIPSPFALDLVDLSRGLVYFETSRGCPYRCSFCMSALDERVRSFSPARIRSDLQLLMDQGVPLIKFVDRTFNYNARRACGIFSYILEHNRFSRFHFEIGAHLLDRATLELLEAVPAETFQFEIGVQSILPQALANVGRRASFERLAENVRCLVEKTAIHLHLDLIAGLPGESYAHFLASIDQVWNLGADHLQIEAVKLLPGSPLRREAEGWGIRFDPNPPYGILGSADLTFAQLDRLRGISRLFDLLVNSGRFAFLLSGLAGHFERLAPALEDLDRYWRETGRYHRTHALRSLYAILDAYLQERFTGTKRRMLRELLARDYAHHERVVGGSEPVFFDTRLSAQETAAVKKRVKRELDGLERSGKVQYFAAVFHLLPDCSGRTLLLFLYQRKNSAGQRVREIKLTE